jgi:hypothetical protein
MAKLLFGSLALDATCVTDLNDMHVTHFKGIPKEQVDMLLVHSSLVAMGEREWKTKKLYYTRDTEGMTVLLRLKRAGFINHAGMREVSATMPFVCSFEISYTTGMYWLDIAYLGKPDGGSWSACTRPSIGGTILTSLDVLVPVACNADTRIKVSELINVLFDSLVVDAINKVDIAEGHTFSWDL